MTSRVFAVHQPTRWVYRERKMEPLDLSPAAAFGELVVILPGLDRPPTAPQALPTLRHALAAFTEADYLVVAGDMGLLVWASALALQATSGKIQLLKWDNRGQCYEVEHAPDGMWTQPVMGIDFGKEQK